MLITDAVQSQAARNPDKTAIFDDTCQITYRELYHRIKKAANFLLTYYENDFDPEATITIVGFLLNNRVELIEFFLAATKIGLCSAIFDPKWSDVNIETIINECKLKVLIVDTELLPRLTNIPVTTKVIAINTKNPLASSANTSHSDGCNEDEPKRASTNGSLFYMGYTSGTTGKPKGFLRSQQSWIESFSMAQQVFSLNEDNQVMAPGPLVHSLTLYAAIQTLYFGGTFHLTSKFKRELALEWLASNPITHIYLVPTMFEAIYNSSISRPLGSCAPTVQSLITSGDKWTPESKQKVKQVFENAGIFEFYGASELSFVTVLDPEGNSQKPDSIGKPFAGVEVSIRKQDGQEASEGEIGQVFIKSKMIFSGYYHNEDETRQVLQGEWATVGDLAMRDSDGFLYMVGRKKNMIISGGLNIYPEEIEKVLLMLDQIEEAVVVGVPDSYWGQKVVALIKLRDGAVLDNQEIKALCRRHLASYKCPKEIIRVASFPYTTSGKISRTKVSELI
ncbi:MAG: AMP-binding protein [Paenibacillaceae bacterium]